MQLSEEIAKTAYELYERSGRMPNRDLDNWLEAERLVIDSHNKGGGNSPAKKARPERGSKKPRADSER